MRIKLFNRFSPNVRRPSNNGFIRRRYNNYGYGYRNRYRGNGYNNYFKRNDNSNNRRYFKGFNDIKFRNRLNRNSVSFRNNKDNIPRIITDLLIKVKVLKTKFLRDYVRGWNDTSRVRTQIFSKLSY